MSFEELRQVMEDYGFVVDRSSGSHYQFRSEVGDQVWKLTIPFRRPHVKTPYVDKALQAIEEITQAQSGESEESDGDTD